MCHLYCSGRRACKENNLLHQFPVIAQEWNYQKNGEANPINYTAKSSRKVWWVCQKGHEWETNIFSRTHSNCGCPYCAGNKPSKEYNLAVVNTCTRKRMASNKK